MGKVRIYELARKLDMQSKELLSVLQELDVEVSSHMSTITDETAELVIDVIDGEKNSGEAHETDESEKTQNPDITGETEVDSEKTMNSETVSPKYTVTPPITVNDLAEKTSYSASKLIKELMSLGVMASVNDNLEAEIIKLLADELNLNLKVEKKENHGSDSKSTENNLRGKDFLTRPPIVTVMGHVDHGKTSLLDVIRETRVAEKEAGGITQHIGAYQVEVNGKPLTFIDTPGHEAFTAMRARGAQITDITILVIAADDGVMPQTVEAINHAQAADIPIIVAINKIDKPNAQPERVKQQLTEYGLVPEDWGGDTICVQISALKQENIDELLEMVQLVAEMEDIKADPNISASGIIIEAELDKGRGPVATVLIKNGTLKVGDSLLAGKTHGRVRAMINERGERIEEAPPSSAVEVLGFSDVPDAGDTVRVYTEEKEARNIAAERQEKEHKEQLRQDTAVSLQDLYDQIQKGKLKELNIIIKADVQGSIEALKSSLLEQNTEEVTLNVIHTGVGGINETDVNLASASNAIIIGFNVRPDNNARSLAEKENVEITTYRVIYKVIEDVRNAMAGLLEPELKEIVKGQAEIRAIFKVPDIGNIAGCYVKEGTINRNHSVRLIRDGIVVHDGEISSLKRFEDDVREVKEGYECGIGIENYNDLKVGDILESYTHKEIKRSL